MSPIASYIDTLDWFADASGASHAMLHIHAGLAIYVLVQLLLRERRASVTALKAVIVAELVHECMQRLHYGEWRWPDTLADVALTILWPALLTATGLYRRRRWKLAEKGERLLRQVSANGPRATQR